LLTYTYERVPNYAPTFNSDFTNIEVTIGEVYLYFYPGYEDKNKGDTLTLSFYPTDQVFMEFSKDKITIFPSTEDQIGVYDI